MACLIGYIYHYDIENVCVYVLFKKINLRKEFNQNWKEK